MPPLSPAELFHWLESTFHGAPQGIIFDCDGVVIDSKRANIGYYNALRGFLGLPPLSPEQEDFVQMATVQQALDSLCPKALFPLLRDAAKRVDYKRDILPKITHYPGLHALLDLCRAHGVRLGMDTNREDGMDVLLENCRLRGYFEPIILASHVRRPKPFPDGALIIVEEWKLAPETLLFLGDSATDMRAARDAGIPFLAFQTEGLSHPSIAHFDTLRLALARFWA